MKKGRFWSKEEDDLLKKYVEKNGEWNWALVARNSALVNRDADSCRQRWMDHLRPGLKKGPFSREEQDRIVELHATLGNKWSRMARELPGRTDYEINNFWNTRKRKLERAGLPLYPAHIEPKKMNDNREGVSGFSSQQANISPADYSLRGSTGIGGSTGITNIPTSELIDDRYVDYNLIHTSELIDSLPSFPPCIEIQDCHTLSSPYDEFFHIPSLPPPSLGGNSVISPPDMVSGLPPFPPCIEVDDSAAPILLCHEFYHIPPMIPYSPSPPPPSPEEGTQNRPLPEPPVSPRSSGLLESIFYPPKVVSEDEKGKQQQPNNSLEKGGDDGSGSNQRDLANLDALVDLGWLGNDWDNDVKDTLYAVVIEGYRRSKK